MAKERYLKHTPYVPFDQNNFTYVMSEAALSPPLMKAASHHTSIPGGRMNASPGTKIALFTLV